ncbi:HBS1-like protein isoform X2 [Pelobates fuscus]|uniref:HBS1-like protein isoform X2 n=1 Tax=Pelobates fuscus TaxID=191477 RepID=UPI002FE4B41C
MARHRNVRGYNYDEDFDDDDLYGHSVEDDYGISPATAAQFIYSKRNRHQSFTEPLEEEHEDDEHMETKAADIALSSVDQARLYSCLDHMREVLGESVSEQVMIDAVLQCKFDQAKALDLIFQQDCNKNLNSATNDLASFGRLSKEAIIPSLQSLVNEQCKCCPIVKSSESFQTDPCFKTTNFKFNLHDGFKNETDKCKASLSTEDTFSSLSSNLSLSTLISDSPEQTFSCPVLSGISLQDLISHSKIKACMGKESDLFDAKLSDSPCSRDTENILTFPGLKETQVEVTLNCSGSNKNADGSRMCGFNSDCFSGNILDNQTTLFGSLSSVLHNTQSGHMSASERNASTTKYGSPSLADLIQEHSEVNPLLDFSLDGPQKKSPDNKRHAEFLLPLSQLSDHSNTKVEMPLLTTSLSSLVVSESFGAEKPTLSLSELIADVRKSDPDDPYEDLLSTAIPLAETGTNIDLSVLINNPGSSDNSYVFHSVNLPAGQIKPNLCNSNTSCKRVHMHKTQSVKRACRAKALEARPSAFALSLCFNYTPKACNKGILMNPRKHLYNPAAIAGELCHSTLTPFDFHTPSPDDIVKENQRKAFVR